MNVESCRACSVDCLRPVPPAVSQEPVTEAPCTAPVPAEGTPASEVATPLSPTPADADKHAKGLLDRLESGHFHPVAALRLSINFFDELQARAAARSERAMAETSGALTDAAGSALESMIGALAPDDETATAVRDLGSSFQDTLGTIISADAPADAGSLEDRIRAAFDQFVGSVRDALAPTPPATPTDAPSPDGPPTHQPTVPLQPTTDTAPPPPPATDPIEPTDPAPPAPPPPSLDDAIATLSQTFGAALATFLDTVQRAAALPQPPAPTGHGRAYEKFLAMYNSLRQPAAPAVDTAA